MVVSNKPEFGSQITEVHGHEFVGTACCPDFNDARRIVLTFLLLIGFVLKAVFSSSDKRTETYHKVYKSASLTNARQKVYQRANFDVCT